MKRLNLSIDQAYNKMFVDCQEFQREGSGWAIDEVLYLKLMMAKYIPLKGLTTKGKKFKGCHQHPN